MLRRMRLLCPVVLAAACNGAAPPASVIVSTPASSTSSTSAPLASPAEPKPAVAEKTYSLVVSFGSIASGTDDAASERLKRVEIPRGAVHHRGLWGKEGEFDECFDLGDVPADKSRAFIDNVRRAIGASAL